MIVDIKYQTYVLDSDGDVASLGVAEPSISSVADRQEVTLELTSQPLSQVAPPVQCCWAHNKLNRFSCLISVS